MVTKQDKRDRAALFRRRLGRALEQAGENQSSLARRVGVDRSTISQLLADKETRLPNAQVVAECASALGVSSDWLLGLSDFPEQANDLLASSVRISAAPRAPIDEEVMALHREAAGYKIRHVPATLPDALKTHEMLRWEYAPHLGRTVEQAINASDDRLEWMRKSQSDFEFAMPLFEIASLVHGWGYYEGIPDEVRMGQITHLIELHRQLYPSLRIFLFDARRLYSAPVTVFGPLVAVIYVGHYYLTFRDTDRVAALIEHFDHLVREAWVDASDFPEHVLGLLRQS